MTRDGRSRRGSQRGADRPTSEDHNKVTYKEARDRFLTRLDEDNLDDILWLVEVGRYVQHYWLAEEAARQNATDEEEFNDREGKYLDLWDEGNEKTFRDLRTEAGVKLARYWRNKRAIATVEWAARLPPWLHGIGWLSKEAFRGFVGGIGLIALGLLIVTVAPRLATSLRTIVDDALPTDTRPDGYGSEEQRN